MQTRRVQRRTQTRRPLCFSRMIYLDNSFTELAGHNLPWAAAVHGEAQKAGLQFRAITHRGLPGGGLGALEHVVERRFRVYAPEFENVLPSVLPRRVRVFLALIAGNVDAANTVARVLWKHRDVLDETVFVVGNTFPSNIVGLAVAFVFASAGVHHADPVDLVCVFHNKPSRRYQPFVRFGLASLRRRTRLRVVVHSERNRDICGHAGDTTLLRLPYVRESRSRRSVDSNRPLTVGFLGIASIAKGFDLAVEAIGELASTSGSRFRFLVQMNPRDSGSVFVKAAGRLDSLARAEPNRVTILRGPLSHASYADAFDECDIVLIPHRASVYGSDESGVFLECVAARKLLVASATSAMGRRVTSGEVSGVTFDDGDFRSLAKAIEKVAAMTEETALRPGTEHRLSAATEMWQFLVGASNKP